MNIKQLRIKRKNEDVLEIPEDLLVEVDTVFPSFCSGVAQFYSRGSSNFKNRSFFLDEEYNWVIGRDDSGQLILVPLKKEVF